MAYSTGTGTLTAMIAALGTFALANGWVAPTPGAHRYWRICTNSTDESSSGSYNLQLEWLDFKDNAGASVGTPGTILVSHNPAAAAAAFVNDNTTWTGSLSSGFENFFIGGDWGSPVDVRRVTIRAPLDTAAPRLVSLEFSDDGINWSVLHCFHHIIYPVDTDQTYIWSNLTWPLSPDGEHFYAMGGDYEPLPGWNSWSEFTASNQAASIRACLFQMTMGKSGLGFESTCLEQLLYPPGNTDIAEWHFFADTTVSKYINVAFKYQWKGEGRWSHWMMGEIDKKGLSHNGVVHLNVDNMYFFANSDSGGTSNHGVGFRNRCPFIPYNVHAAALFRMGSWRFKSGGAYPVPNDGAWPNRTDVHNNSRLAPTLLQKSSTSDWGNALSWAPGSGGNHAWPGANGWGSDVNPVSGFVTLGTIPFIVNAGNDFDDLFGYLGEFPDVRSVNIRAMSEGEEITVGTDTWKCFPRLRKLASYTTQFQPGSGWAGWAYRKVV